MKVTVVSNSRRERTGKRLFSRQFGYRCLAFLSTALGMIGVILPLLPTTPFLIVAVWSASRSSPRLEQWLLNHRQFGPLLRGWHERGAILVFAKYLAGFMLTSSWLVLWLLNMKIGVLIFLAVFFLALMIYIISRPNA